MREFFKNLIVVSIPSLFIVFLLLEIFLRVGIPATSWPSACFDQEEKIFKFCMNGSEGTATFGKLAKQRGRWRVNNHGWNSPVDYNREKTRKRIAVIGDSYIEAFQVDNDKTYPSLLREDIGDRYDVYSFGISGSPLSQYLHMSRYARKNFDPDVLIFNVRYNDFLESIYERNRGDTVMMMLSITDSSIVETTPRPNYSFSQFSWKKRLLRKSAIVRYMVFNLRIKQVLNNLRSQDTYSGNVEVEGVEQNRDLIAAAARYIFTKIDEENPGRRIIFVMAAPKHAIYDGTVSESRVRFLNSLVVGLCGEHDFEVIDLTNPMMRDYEANQTRFNSPWDGHWNEYGHEIVFRQVLALGWP